MPHEYLSDYQVGRYGQFVADPTHEELERFFFLDEEALAEAGTRRGPHNKLGVGSVGNRADARHVPDRLRPGAGAGGGDPVCRRAAGDRGWTAVKQYGDRPATPYDHAAQIRKLLGYREFTGAEAEVTAFIASRVAKTRDSKRELFDRAVLWLIENRVLLPGISTMSRLVAEVRRTGLAAINSTLVDAAPPHMHGELAATLTVPDGKKVSVLETVAELLPLPSAEDDGDLEWRVELMERYATVRQFLEQLASAVPWGSTAAGSQIVAAVKALPRVTAARKPGAEHLKGFEDLVTGSWRRLVFGNPRLDPPLIDRPAYVFCILEALHSALRHRDVYAVGADKWGNPRARLIEERLWVRERASALTALGLEADPRAHLRELAGLVDDAYTQVAAGLAANPSVQVRNGKLHISRLEAAPLPEGFKAVHDAVQAMMPRIDYPELLLETHGRTGMFDCMEHISGSPLRRDDLDISLAALTVARSCKTSGWCRWRRRGRRR